MPMLLIDRLIDVGGKSAECLRCPGWALTNNSQAPRKPQGNGDSGQIRDTSGRNIMHSFDPLMVNRGEITLGDTTRVEVIHRAVARG